MLNTLEKKKYVLKILSLEIGVLRMLFIIVVNIGYFGKIYQIGGI